MGDERRNSTPLSEIELQSIAKLVFGLMFVGGFIWMGCEANSPDFNNVSWVFTVATGVASLSI